LGARGWVREETAEIESAITGTRTPPCDNTVQGTVRKAKERDAGQGQSWWGWGLPWASNHVKVAATSATGKVACLVALQVLLRDVYAEAAGRVSLYNRIIAVFSLLFQPLADRCRVAGMLVGDLDHLHPGADTGGQPRGGRPKVEVAAQVSERQRWPRVWGGGARRRPNPIPRWSSKAGKESGSKRTKRVGRVTGGDLHGRRGSGSRGCLGLGVSAAAVGSVGSPLVKQGGGGGGEDGEETGPSGLSCAGCEPAEV